MKAQDTVKQCRLHRRALRLRVRRQCSDMCRVVKRIRTTLNIRNRITLLLLVISSLNVARDTTRQRAYRTSTGSNRRVDEGSYGARVRATLTQKHRRAFVVGRVRMRFSEFVKLSLDKK